MHLSKTRFFDLPHDPVRFVRISPGGYVSIPPIHITKQELNRSFAIFSNFPYKEFSKNKNSTPDGGPGKVDFLFFPQMRTKKSSISPASDFRSEFSFRRYETANLQCKTCILTGFSMISRELPVYFSKESSINCSPRSCASFPKN